MLGDHHWDFALLHVLHTPRQSAAHHSDDKIHALSGCIRSRGNSDAFADKPAQDQQPVYGCRAGNWQDAQHPACQQLHGGTGLTDCLVQTAPPAINLHIAGVIEGLPQFCQTILQIVHCFFGVIGFVELPVQRMRDADTLFTGEGQNQLFLPAAQFNVYRHPTFAGGFCQCLLPVMIKITV